VKIGILAGSLLAGILGWSTLRIARREERSAAAA